jgi:protein O-mannosyl-transferase
VDAAIAEYGAALQIKPAYLEARTNLATVLAAIPSRLPDAVREYRAALEIDPESVEAHYDLALVLVRMPGRESDAIAELETVMRLRPEFAQPRNILEQLRKTRNAARSAGGNASR